MKDLKDKVVLITGASGGIGEAAARAFSREGARVAISARRREKLEQVAAGIPGCLVLPADLSDEEQVRQVMEKTFAAFGTIDILVNNAASIIVSSADQVKSEDLIRAFRTNLVAPVIACQVFYEYMKPRGGGQVINVGSPGFMMGIPFYSPYVCSKAALSAWTRTIQSEWAGTGIIISEYFPGYIKTDSRPESRVGVVDQDFLMSPKQNFITNHFAKPETADKVARDLVKLAKRPKPLMHSGFGVKLGTYISNIPGFRLAIATQMARTARGKMQEKEGNRQ
jgi:NAD(P)-dependent dehydrogenase (short-subunit alcohol dehydrogenase family)